MADPIKGTIELDDNLDGKPELTRGVTISGDFSNLIRQVASPQVSLNRAAAAATPDLLLWVIIRKSTEALSFNNYNRFMNMVLCQPPGSADPGFAAWKKVDDEFDALAARRALPFNNTDAYRLLKVATEAFLTVNCGVEIPDKKNEAQTFLTSADVEELHRKLGPNSDAGLADLWIDHYLKQVNGLTDPILPYLALIREKLSDSRIKDFFFAAAETNGRTVEDCIGILRRKLMSPCFFELIWSYWHEEGMLVQTLNAISLRFQNVRGARGHDPLQMLELDPLRPLNNLLWGYIQDEQHRLSVMRRAYEYDHHYALTLEGKAVPQLRTADSRSKFIESFHNLLYLCSVFYKEDDDTTVLADGFPLLNALKDVHFLLSEGAHNQFGDLPSTARQEMLIQQWLLARPEFREFLPTRTMVAYPEPWMDRVDAMKSLQNWNDTSVLHFRNLAVFGEQLLLSIRYGAWSSVDDRDQAANWARFWRSQNQGYIYAYRAATGVDLTVEANTQQQTAARAMQPATLLRQRIASQRNRLAARSAQRA